MLLVLKAFNFKYQLALWLLSGSNRTGGWDCHFEMCFSAHNGHLSLSLCHGTCMYKYTLVDVKIPCSSPYAAAEPAPCFTRCLLLLHTYPASLGLVQMPALNPMDVPLSDHISEGAILLRFLTEGLEGGDGHCRPFVGSAICIWKGLSRCICTDRCSIVTDSCNEESLGIR